MIQTDLGSLILIQITPKEPSLKLFDRMFDGFQILSNTIKGGQTVKCLVTKQCLMVFVRQTFPVWTGLKSTLLSFISTTTKYIYITKKCVEIGKNPQKAPPQHHSGRKLQLTYKPTNT